MAKILNLVIVDHADPFKAESYVYQFRCQESLQQPEKALREAVKEFVASGTPESKNALNSANGYYNWADAMSTVPDSIFEKHGLTPIYQDDIDITVDHDEVLCGDLSGESEENGDTFSIYQIKNDDGLRHIRFVGYDQLIGEGCKIDIKNYDHVYTGALSDKITLDSLFHTFNENHPDDYTGRSLSISDVIVLYRGGTTTAYYVDGPFAGFRELPEFHWRGEFWPEGFPDVPIYPKDTL